MGNRDKDKEMNDSGTTGTMGEGTESACDASQAAWDLSRRQPGSRGCVKGNCLAHCNFHSHSQPEWGS